MSGSDTLRHHRQQLAANPAAYTQDIPRTKRTIIKHLKDCGYSLLKESLNVSAVDDLVDVIFETQQRHPFFHIENELPYCWNAPMDWDKNYIRYQWGHLISRNQNVTAHQLTNLCLQSARCNQHIQTSMDISEVSIWLEGSAVAKRIADVLAARESLFTSPRWHAILDRLARYRQTQSELFPK